MDEQPPNETKEPELMLKNDAMQVPTNMEQQPQCDGAIGHANPSDPMEVGVVYMKMNDAENMEGNDTWANMPIIKERLKGLGLEHDNIEKAYKIHYLKVPHYKAYVNPYRLELL